MGLGPWDIYSDDQNPAPAYTQAAQSLVGDSHPTEVHFDTSIPQFGEPVDGWLEPRRSPDSEPKGGPNWQDAINRTPARTTDLHMDLLPSEESRLPSIYDPRQGHRMKYGNQIGQELMQEGIDPTDFRASGQHFADQLGMDPEVLRRYQFKDQNKMPGMAGQTSRYYGEPYNPMTSTTDIVNGMPPEMRLDVQRHEMQHDADFDSIVGEAGLGAAAMDGKHDILPSIMPHHFSNGDELDAEPTWVKRPYMLR